MKTQLNNFGLERSVIHLLHRAGQRAFELFQSEGALKDLTPRQFAVLLAVSENEGASQTFLVNATGIDRSTLADLVRRMIAKGLLQRQRTTQDARVYSVKLTDTGRSVLAEAEPSVVRIEQCILSELHITQRSDFISCLNRIVESMSDQEWEELGSQEIKFPTNTAVKHF